MKRFLFIIIMSGIISIILFTIIFGGNDSPKKILKNLINSQVVNTGEKINNKNPNEKNSFQSSPEFSEPSEKISSGCKEEQISYSLTNLAKSSKCDAYDGEICTSKTAVCSLTVTNLEKETGGEFIISFNYFLIGSGETIEKEEKSATLSKGDSEKLESEIKIFSQGTDGNANKEISCSYSPKKIPVKPFCS